MPELPEVETIRNILKSIVIGKTISNVDVFREKTILSDVNEFKNNLVGATIKDIERKGKFLIFVYDNNYALLSHLRMEGKYYLLEEETPNTKYARVVFHFTDNTKLCFDDSRCFGIMKLAKTAEIYEEKELKSLGLEPFEISDVDFLMKRNKKSNKPIKSTLLDQTQIAGLGNIYADEVLFYSGINPLEKAKDITKDQWKTIIKNAVIILNNAIKDGGSTVHSYHPADGIDGNFQTKLKAYGKRGENCPNCGHELYYKKINGRGSTYCPMCQKKQHPPIFVGLTGPISSGKSVVLEIFKREGCSVLSCDEVVHELYKQPEVITKISSITGLKFGNEVDRNALREYTNGNLKALKRIDNYIHPLVRKYVSEFLDEACGSAVVEVPLLFESHFQDLFDYIVAVSISKDRQLKYLRAREEHFEEMLELNGKENTFYTEKADYVIKNDGDLEQLSKEVKTFLRKVQRD
ncbi:MAG: DNA-formamidopyrimidine glycosylase [Coprobacillus sp.]|nr:DNA-formamidopyrimidine glycosylase [Coprobacillus sp.]